MSADKEQLAKFIKEANLLPYSNKDLESIKDSAEKILSLFKDGKVEGDLDLATAGLQLASFVAVLSIQKDLLTVNSLAEKINAREHRHTEELGDVKPTRHIRRGSG